jgi:hypothetical protein
MARAEGRFGHGPERPGVRPLAKQTGVRPLAMAPKDRMALQKRDRRVRGAQHCMAKTEYPGSDPYGSEGHGES